MGESSNSEPVDEHFVECDESQSERTSDNSKDYVSCEELKQNTSDCANPIRQQKRKIVMEELEETDHFEDTESTPSFSSDDNKVHLKRSVNPEKKNLVDPKKMRLDFDRINELDKFRNIPPARSFFNHSLVAQAEDFRRSAFNYFHDAIPGPSDLTSRKKKKAKKPIETTEDDVTVEEDVKAIADCLLENTLNVLDISTVTVYTDDLIEFNVMAPEPLAYQNCENNRDPVVSSGTIEGNSIMPFGNSVEKNQVPSGEPKTVDTSGEQNEIFENCIAENTESCYDPITSMDADEEHDEDDNESVSLSVARASKEALRDPDSVPDLLEDFEIPAPVQEGNNNVFDAMEFGNGTILIGIIPVENTTETQVVATNGFPHWLLQILGTQVIAEEAVNPVENAEQPHYYCQGDGIGVHPSILAVELDEDDVEASTETSSDNTVAEVDPGLSSQEISSLPEDSQAAIEPQELLPDDEGSVYPESNEFYDTISSSSDTVIGSGRNI